MVLKRIKNNDLHRIIIESINKILDGKETLNEYAYERSAFVSIVDTNARNAYTHLAKIILYGNSTMDVNGWINEIAHKFTTPMLLGKLKASEKARIKVLSDGYVYNIFGDGFEDYAEQMSVFCDIAIDDVEGNAKKRGLPIPKHREVNEAITFGYGLIMCYADIVLKLINSKGGKDEINSELDSGLRGKVKEIVDF